MFLLTIHTFICSTFILCKAEKILIFIFKFQIEILETYSNPRDSKQQLAQDETDIKCFTSPDREYSQPYTTGKRNHLLVLYFILCTM